MIFQYSPIMYRIIAVNLPLAPRLRGRFFEKRKNNLSFASPSIRCPTMKEDDISISAICDYVTLIETDEIYDGYRTIYQQYFADEGCDFMISYSASGNSRAILHENEEIIEFLAYDRLSENEKCELYVLYRSKKNADGSWHISEAEILDIFAYNVSTKDVVSSGKTSWSATGNEKYYEVTGEK